MKKYHSEQLLQAIEIRFLELICVYIYIQFIFFQNPQSP